VMNGSAGFIDRRGKIVIPCMYEPDFDNHGNYRFFFGFANVKQGGKWGVIDEKNRVVIPFLYDEFLEKNDSGFRYAMRDGKKLSVDTKGNEWEMIKRPDARTFRDYLHAVDWREVEKCFKAVGFKDGSGIEKDLKIYEKNFYSFKSKSFKPSGDIIRIHTIEESVFATFFDVTKDSSYDLVDWAEMLDMEVRIEDNLALSDAEVVVHCIYAASCDWDGQPAKEEHNRRLPERLHEKIMAVHESIMLYHREWKTISVYS
jgi:hypothetical protein